MNILFIFLLSAAIFCAVQMSRWDFRERIIPDVYLFPFLLIGLIVAAFFPWAGDIAESVVAGAFGYFLGMIMNLVFKKKNPDAIGMGDIKLLAAGGIWLGMTGLSIALVASCIFGGIWGMKKKQKFIPFAPFFFAGMILALTALFIFI